MKEKNICELIFLFFVLICLKEKIICDNYCFEYSCEICKSTKYGDCTKCYYGYKLVDGT